MDSYWGGKNDLTAALGFEKDGVTTIIFRKKIKCINLFNYILVYLNINLIYYQATTLSVCYTSLKANSRAFILI